MSKKTVLPRLRFPAFKDNPEWSIDALKDFSTPITKRAGTKEYTLLSVTSGIGLVSQVEKFGREIAGSSYKNYITIRQSDFAYNKSATKLFPEGYISMLTNYENGAVPNSIFTCFRITDEHVYRDFINHLFQSNYHGHWLHKFIAVGARAHGSLNIDDKHLWALPIALPKLEEQQKIAGCLSSLDDIIAAESKKLDILKTHKKGLMQKLFPTEGKVVPEWRFPEFRDSRVWEEATLSKLANFRRGSFPQPYGLPEWYDEKDGMPFIQVFDVGEDMRVKPTTKNKISTLATKQSVFIPKGTVIITIQGSIGRVAVTQYDAYVDRTLLLFERFHQDIDKAFIAHTLKLLFDIEKQKAPGGIIKTITKEVLSDFKVKIPDVKEQQKISECLSSLDEKITAQAERIEALKQHKKGLMQGLFPSAQEEKE